mmetsp:Transcript_14417/g.27112  ORF Transcript_14417/g.27112 Transcript_14417/m.27112 type:complete len:96 (+) Transcript_14417:938-1225(+)
MWWSDEDIQKAQVVKCKSLKNILVETVGDKFHFDFFPLDVEGAEHALLSSIDFSRVSFGVIFVEEDEHNPMKNIAVRMLLEKNGYTFTNSSGRSG